MSKNADRINALRQEAATLTAANAAIRRTMDDDPRMAAMGRSKLAEGERRLEEIQNEIAGLS